MTVTEAERLTMHTGLRDHMGEEVGDLLMAHLPPTGWGDVARKQDVLALKEDVLSIRADISSLRREISDVRREFTAETKSIRREHKNEIFQVKQELGRRIDSITHAMWTMTTIFSAAFIALFSLIAARL